MEGDHEGGHRILGSRSKIVATLRPEGTRGEELSQPVSKGRCAELADLREAGIFMVRPRPSPREGATQTNNLT